MGGESTGVVLTGATAKGGERGREGAGEAVPAACELRSLWRRVEPEEMGEMVSEEGVENAGPERAVWAGASEVM